MGGTKSMPGGEGMPRMDLSKPGMNHGSMRGMDHNAVPGMGAMDMSGAKPPTVNADGVDPQTLASSPWAPTVAMLPKSRLAEAGDGLDGNGRRVLTYAQLKALRPSGPVPPIQRNIEFHLTGNMERFVWGFDGKKFSEAGSVHVKLGERVRFEVRFQKSMSPIPPPCGMAGVAFFSGFSATIASVVTSNAATDAASCKARRTTLVGSMMPALSMSTYSLV
jgi:FtsP/CotA-like multicopper oxidase with cupredoxin domain